MQQQIARDQFIKIMDGRTKMMGDASSGNLKSVHSTKAFPGQPDGSYVAFRFEVQFSKADRYPYFMEGVLVELGKDGQWRVLQMFGT